MVFSKRAGNYSSCVRGIIQRVGGDFVNICSNGKMTSIRIKDISKIEWINCNPCLDDGEIGEPIFSGNAAENTQMNSHAYYYKIKSRMNTVLTTYPVQKPRQLESSSKVESSLRMESSSKVKSSSRLESSSKVESSSRLESSSKVESSSRLESSSTAPCPPESSVQQLSASESAAISNIHSFESRENAWESSNGWESSSDSGEAGGIEDMLKQHVGGIVQICVCRCG
ncbi:hypothetical protein ACF5W4_05325 [Bacillota bacterium Lsc_1132]